METIGGQAVIFIIIIITSAYNPETWGAGHAQATLLDATPSPAAGGLGARQQVMQSHAAATDTLSTCVDRTASGTTGRQALHAV
jgi:hypothetical protein